MEIYVTTGTGEGPTAIAAFDAALIDAGIESYNLIYLSSVIPSGSSVRREKFKTRADEYGHRLYVVISRQDERQPGRTACAGIGWTQDPNTGRGLFVELHASSRAQVEDDIGTTLAHMMASRPISFGKVESEIAEIKCETRPVCALAIAVYESIEWKA